MATTPRYRRIIADEFIDDTPTRRVRRCCYAATAQANGERPRFGGVAPGTALVAGPDLLPGQTKLNPGATIPVETPTPTFALAGVNPVGPIYIADIDALSGRNDMYALWSFNSIEAIPLSEGRALNVLVRQGANIVAGAGLTTDAAGRFVPAGANDRVIMIADESFNNTTGVYQHVRALPVIGA